MVHPQENARLRTMRASDLRISWTKHAEQRAIEREIEKFSAERVVNGGTIIAIEFPAGGDELWTIQGVDCDGRTIGVVVAVKGAARLAVITVL